jgi:hypothetical protein
MAVTILDSPNVSNGSYHANITVTSGNNRWLYVCIFQGTESTLVEPTGVTVGGNAMTVIPATAAGGIQAYVSVWCMKESLIQSGSQALSVNGETDARRSSIWWSVQDADQTGTGIGNHTYGEYHGDTGSSEPTSGSTGSFARAASGYTGAAYCVDFGSTTATTLSNPTNDGDAAEFPASSFSAYQYGREQSTSETVTTDFANGPSTRDQQLVAWNIGPANPPAPGTISYDIGWT